MIAKFKGFRSETMQADEKTLDLYIYDVISVWGVSAADVAEALHEAGDVDKINLYINSPGGSIWEGMAIVSLLRRHKAQVNVWIDSIAASMASLIMLVGDTVTMMPGAMVMIHNPSGGICGQARDIKKYACLLDKYTDIGVAMYAARTSQTPEQIREWMDEETWFTPEEAVEAGFADAISDEGEDASLMFDLSHFKNVPSQLKGTNLPWQHAGEWGATVAKYDQTVLEMAAVADFETIESLATAMTKRDRDDVPDGNTSVPSHKENKMDPKLINAMKKAGLVGEEATKHTAEAVLGTWYSMQNREQPEAVDAIVADIEAGAKTPVPDGKLLTTQDEIDKQIADATAEATEAVVKERDAALSAAASETKTIVLDVLARCETAGQPLATAIELVKLDSVESVKDALIAKLCEDRQSVGTDESSQDTAAAAKQKKWQAEFDALGGADKLGCTLEQYIESSMSVLPE